LILTFSIPAGTSNDQSRSGKLTAIRTTGSGTCGYNLQRRNAIAKCPTNMVVVQASEVLSNNAVVLLDVFESNVVTIFGLVASVPIVCGSYRKNLAKRRV